jgi:hypothetical protein
MENKQYVVKVMHFFASYIETSADNEDQAKLRVKDILSKEDILNKHKHFYEATIPDEHWGVITKEEFDKLQSKETQEVTEQKN